MGKPIQLGELQLAIMRLLWERREATASELHEALWPERRLAPTTVATMLRKMERKGVVSHRLDGRRFVYRPAVSEDAVARSMVGQLTDNLFGGDAAALVSHLISTRKLGPRELAELRDLIAEAARKERNR
jgi:predicted transcriptional regulator